MHARSLRDGVELLDDPGQLGLGDLAVGRCEGEALARGSLDRAADRASGGLAEPASDLAVRALDADDRNHDGSTAGSCRDGSGSSLSVRTNPTISVTAASSRRSPF